MWWLATTSAPLATAIVHFSSAPTASDGVGDAERQHHRLGRVARATGAAAGGRPPVARGDGVVAADVDRPVVGEQAVDERAQPGRRRRRRRARWARRCRFPLVITSGRPTPASSRWCSGRVRQQQAELGQARRDRRRRDRADARRGASTIGRRGESSAAGGVVVERAHRPATSRSATITANGLSSRRLAAPELARRRRRWWRRPRGGSRRCP